MTINNDQKGSGTEDYGVNGALNQAAALLYDAVMDDDLLRPIFGAGRSAHLDHFTMFMGDFYGAQTRFTSEFSSLDMIVAKHPGLQIDQNQRTRFVQHMRAAASSAGLRAPTNPATSTVK